jgi:GrpB-like predicted nucleotidyltransferase (UPF0157 family)
MDDNCFRENYTRLDAAFSRGAKDAKGDNKAIAIEHIGSTSVKGLGA